jgi:hypothetical protein
MKRVFLPGLLLFIMTLKGFSQADTLKAKKKGKGMWYVTWGYTKAYYSKSTIHFKDLSGKYHPATGNNNYYDFTIYDVKAKDRPDYDKIRDVINVTIPQFVFRIGYSFNEKWGFELNYDHAKYVVTDYQKTHIKGQIFGQPVDKDTIMEPNNFLHFEHTDGANFWLFNAVRRWTLYRPSKSFRASWVLKPGAGFVYPRTDVRIFGEELNNNWHISGWIVSVESGLRLEFLGNGIFEFVGKGSYADYTKCLVLGKGNGSASHHFFCAQMTATIGFRFGAGRHH